MKWLIISWRAAKLPCQEIRAPNMPGFATEAGCALGRSAFEAAISPRMALPRARLGWAEYGLSERLKQCPLREVEYSQVSKEFGEISVPCCHVARSWSEKAKSPLL